MGNVLAASSGIESTAARSNSVAASLGLPEPAPLSGTADGGVAGGLSGGSGAAGSDAAGDVAKDSPLENPGTVEELHKKCKGMRMSPISLFPAPLLLRCVCVMT